MYRDNKEEEGIQNGMAEDRKNEDCERYNVIRR